MAIARLNGEVIAESTETIVVAGAHYFPPQSVRAELLRPSSTRHDEWCYYSVTLHGEATPNVAHSVIGPAIPDPRIAEHLTFDRPVEIEIDD